MDASFLSTTSNATWITDFTPSRQSRVRLLCLPYAGGGANIYRGWASTLPGWIGVLGAQLPGREIRISEPPPTKIGDVVDPLAEAVMPLTEAGPLALFGHSMGAILAYEIARALRARGAREPDFLLLSGRRAPNHPRLSRLIHDLPDTEFRRALGRLGGTPPEVLANDELMGLMLPMLRADFTLAETWHPVPSAPLSCPVATFAGDDDSEAPPASLLDWGKTTTGTIDHHVLAGGHFFLNDSRSALLGLVVSTLGRL